MRLNDLLACVQLTRGAAWASSGHYAEAYDELCKLFDPTQPCYHLRESYTGIPLLAEAAIRTQREAQAR